MAPPDPEPDLGRPPKQEPPVASFEPLHGAAPAAGAPDKVRSLFPRPANPLDSDAPFVPPELPQRGPSASLAGCAVTIVELDFQATSAANVGIPQIAAALEAGRFIWVDVDFQDNRVAREVLASLGLIPPQLVDELFEGEAGTQLSRYREYLHLVLSGFRLTHETKLDIERVDVVIGERFLLTVHEGPRIFLDAVRRDYYLDFVRFAKSPSFLIYELWDNLMDHYIHVQKRLERRVERLQGDLLNATDDRVFAYVSDLGSNLLHFRSVIMPARAVLSELSTRRSIFISEATQGFLANMVGTLERVLQDVLVDRDVLAQSLNLYVLMVSHRTNRAMNKLTVISTIFLPLTFLCGVYGMNFDVLPELHWRFGYALFWGTVLVIAGALLMIMRRAKLL